MSQSPSALKVQLTMLMSGTWSQLALAATLCPSSTCKGHGLSGSRMLLSASRCIGGLAVEQSTQPATNHYIP